jgi:hypothetical protein
MEFAGLQEKSGPLRDSVLNTASLMDTLQQKEECAARCDSAITGLRKIVREVQMFRTSANVELQVMATVAAGLQGMGTMSGVMMPLSVPVAPISGQTDMNAID